MNTIELPRDVRSVNDPTEMLQYRVLSSISQAPCAGLRELIPGEPESWEFYKAIESVPPPGFSLGAIAAIAGDRTLALTPIFETKYRLDTPLQGPLRRVTDWLNEKRSDLTSLSVVGMGSPMSDNLTIGFAPDLRPELRCAAFEGMLSTLRNYAKQQKHQLIAVKSIDGLAREMGSTLAGHDFNCVTSVPLAMLDMRFGTLEAYLDSLRPKTARYLMRKYRPAQTLRMAYVKDITPYEGDIYKLFRNTIGQSRVSYGSFQELQPAYFGRINKALRDQARYMLIWRGDELLSFQLFLYSDTRIVAKQIGMKYPEARELNLYFVNWLELIKFAIEHRIPKIEMGATTYATKLLFGGYLERRLLYFRFRRDISNLLLRPLASLFDFEKNDPELMTLDIAHLKNMRVA